MEPTEALVSIKNMTFSRGERKIFDDVTLDVPKGKVTAIMGAVRYRENHLTAAYWRADSSRQRRGVVRALEYPNSEPGVSCIRLVTE